MFADTDTNAGGWQTPCTTRNVKIWVGHNVDYLCLPLVIALYFFQDLSRKYKKAPRIFSRNSWKINQKKIPTNHMMGLDRMWTISVLPFGNCFLLISRKYKMLHGIFFERKSWNWGKFWNLEKSHQLTCHMGLDIKWTISVLKLRWLLYFFSKKHKKTQWYFLEISWNQWEKIKTNYMPAMQNGST